MINVSWDEFFGLTHALSDKLKDEDFDSVVCINRGGLVVGRVLSDALGLPLGVISAKSYDVGKVDSAGKVVVDEKVSIVGDVGRKVLIVDDIADNGGTFMAVKSFFEDERGLSVLTAAVFRKEGCAIDVDFCASEVGREWIVMPYEVCEFSEGGEA